MPSGRHEQMLTAYSAIGRVECTPAYDYSETVLGSYCPAAIDGLTGRGTYMRLVSARG